MTISELWNTTRNMSAAELECFQGDMERQHERNMQLTDELHKKHMQELQQESCILEAAITKASAEHKIGYISEALKKYMEVAERQYEESMNLYGSM